MHYFVLVDIAGIQSYVFGSNVLRDNLGGSYLVAAATRAWAIDLLPASNNVNPSSHDLNAKTLEQDNLAVEVIYAGGGNLAAVFADQKQASAFSNRLQRKVLLYAPGMRLFAQIEPFEWDEKPAVWVDRAIRKLARQKRESQPTSIPWGFAVTESCRNTGGPAEAFSRSIENTPGYPVSLATLAKQHAYDAANKRLNEEIPPPSGYLYPYRFEDLGRSFSEKSYIAVVHADGDGIGSYLDELTQKAPNTREYINNIRTASKAIKAASKTALEATMKAMVDKVDNMDKGRIATNKPLPDIELQPHNNRYFLPARPVVFGGDDVTFVCDARLGVSAAQLYTQCFGDELTNRLRAAKLLDADKAKSASAGVAMVHAHFPFSRAYALSESLLKSAKNKGLRREPALDWHILMEGESGSIDDLRRRYKKEPFQRPILMREGQTLSHWNTIKTAMDGLRTWPRNKVKALRDVLLDDRETEAFLTVEEKTLPDLDVEHGKDTLSKTGWSSAGCGYWDALELMELYYPLTPAGQKETDDEHVYPQSSPA